MADTIEPKRPTRPTRKQCQSIIEDAIKSFNSFDLDSGGAYVRYSHQRQARVRGLLAGLAGHEIVAASKNTEKGYAVGYWLRPGSDEQSKAEGYKLALERVARYGEGLKGDKALTDEEAYILAQAAEIIEDMPL